MSAPSTNICLPSGGRVLVTFPDVLFITDFIFGGLVWILVASTRIDNSNLGASTLQGWVMFVSVFCFVITTVLLVLYFIGAHGGKSSWITLDAFYHCLAALFYLSAAVLQAVATRIYLSPYKVYQENIAAVVFAYLATLSYVVHAVGSLLRWKKSS
ncbi:myelin and lymphocyte protein isoform X2 [Rhinatrema bivittatum]|uniref:myelin and lymphocyte protein isoform X2 n=1 Tax=Rhinatrema bivittatum TaxID=194408 RepID=UPI00112CC391|nr:myelin and lymphocyte protein isoform X2 [Rhinatrema bivittatum]